jgi:FAD/FMN-containing dehydrogenase
MAVSRTESLLLDAEVRAFQSRLHGELVLPGEGSYDSARAVFNAMIDKRPRLIVRCRDAADVSLAVHFAREHDLLVAVRGGGHSIGGQSVCEGGLLIDLSAMKGLLVDGTTRRARAEPGLRLGEFDRGTQVVGQATPLGIMSNTGIAGLTLGGGIGWLNGSYGLACDNVISAEVVCADGKLRTASTTENDDLYWGLRGGGGNFGIVTALEYRLHAVDQVLGGMLLFEIGRAKEVLEFFDEFASGCPDELTMAASLLTGADGSSVVAIVLCYCGPLPMGEETIRPLRRLGAPLDDLVRPMKYIEMQSLLDESFPPGRLHYWKASFIRRLTRGAIDTLLDFAAEKPSPHSAIVFQQVHGAAARVAPDETAFPHRVAQYDLAILTQWSEAADSEQNIQWTRQFWAAMQPFVEPSVYVNDLGEEGHDRVREAYGVNHERLAELKNKYDPSNFFRLNQNIRPSSTPGVAPRHPPGQAL